MHTAAAILGTIIFIWFMIAVVSAAYRNGINDGYGYSREPTNPGYRKAGRYLKRYCAHRWPELHPPTSDMTSASSKHSDEN